MKAKTIAKNIKEKVDEWADSLGDDALAKQCKKDIIVTGGCIASMFLQEPVNDYDVYFRRQETILKLTIHYIKQQLLSEGCRVVPMVRITFKEGHYATFRVNDIEDEDTTKFKVIDLSQVNCDSISRVEVYVKSQGFSAEDTTAEYKYFESRPPEEAGEFIEDLSATVVDQTGGETNGDSGSKRQKYKPIFLSSNAITLSDKFQIVLRFSGSPEDVHESYDFVHATNYWTQSDGLVTNAEALECLLAKELVYRGSLYPMASIFRTRKFITRNWRCHIGNYLKMCLQLNDFDLNDPHVLQEQLTGVDAAYLYQVLQAITQKRKDDPSFVFNSAYICELVDRMMG